MTTGWGLHACDISGQKQCTIGLRNYHRRKGTICREYDSETSLNVEKYVSEHGAGATKAMHHFSNKLEPLINFSDSLNMSPIIYHCHFNFTVVLISPF